MFRKATKEQQRSQHNGKTFPFLIFFLLYFIFYFTKKNRESCLCWKHSFSSFLRASSPTLSLLRLNSAAPLRQCAIESGRKVSTSIFHVIIHIKIQVAHCYHRRIDLFDFFNFPQWERCVLIRYTVEKHVMAERKTCMAREVSRCWEQKLVLGWRLEVSAPSSQAGEDGESNASSSKLN